MRWQGREQSSNIEDRRGSGGGGGGGGMGIIGIIVESYISYLRRKLAVEGASGELIHTKRGVGYILRAED